MPKTKISEFSATPANNTDIDSINIAEGCAPSGINDAIRELMAQLKDFQTGAVGDSFNGPVGTSTAAAGAFTTLAASGNVTLSGGTANGVAYLNGSKVVTTGSALTFDGSSLTASGYLIGNALQAKSGGLLYLYNSTNGNYATLGAPAGTGDIAFSTGAGEQMRLTSTGLGIGTSSPAYKLDVRGDVVGGLNNKIGIRRSDGAFVSYLQNSGDTETKLVSDGGGSTLTFYTEGAKKATLDSSGNLGLGVTPSAWRSGGGVLEINAATNGYIAINNGGGGILQNAYRDASGFVYKNTGAATYFQIGSDGAYTWNRASSGTAGNAITFTQALTLTADGDLCVGTTAKVYEGKISVSFNGNGGSGDQGIAFIDTNASLSGDYALFVNSSGNVAGRITHNGTTTVAYTTSSDYRLKNITGPVTNSGAYIDSLNPVEGTWKSDGATFVGLIAHEVQESSRTPIATGVKDGAEMQAMDYSSAELIANLIAEVKSLRQRVATLEAQ
jgi:hypothetical protein